MLYKVISSKPERKAEIEALGAEAAIGSLADVDFLTRAFRGADAAYTMLPPDPGLYADPQRDALAEVRRMLPITAGCWPKTATATDRRLEG